MKALQLVGTDRNVGKTTMALGLLAAMRQRGLRVGYMKPLGQHTVKVDGAVIHEDARLIATLIGAGDVEQFDMAVPLPSGRVEQAVHNFNPGELLDRAVATYRLLEKNHDLVLIEGMGNVAMGSCLGTSGADVCRVIGARPLLISGGGIGRTLDEISLCATFMQARGVEMLGVVINKIWPQKFDRIKQALTRGLENLNYRCFGTVQYRDQLSSPTMQQVHEFLGGELLGGREHLDHRVKHTIIAAMEARNMIRYIEGSTLVITPGDRGDNMLAALRAHLLGDDDTQAVSGLVLTGDMRPDPEILERIDKFHLPVISVKEDTYSTASKIINHVFKIPPDDQERINWAVGLAADVDVDGILQALQ